MAVLLSVCALGQNTSDTQLIIRKAKGEIKLDGRLDEEDWHVADKADGFWQNFPVDTAESSWASEARLTFDDNFLYVAYKIEAPKESYLVSSLRRDFDFGPNENISIYFDPFSDRTNGFTFGITPYGVQREGLVTERENVSEEWDNKWFSEVHNEGKYWTAELAIPFKTIRYSEDTREWNLQFIRNDLNNNERSTWTAVPIQFRASNLIYAGSLLWEDPPPPPGMNVSVIPYVAGNTNRDYQTEDSWSTGGNVGFDAKVGVTPSLNLDLTFNPDFSQVEVDRQVINLSRFELRFPERRQFFLENADLFSQGGFPRSRPFFSRRIGIASDTAGNQIQIPIQYGARLSGKVDKNWRVGLLNMQTGKRENAVLPGAENPNDGYTMPGQNYTVAVLQRQLLKNSNMTAIFVNRQSTGALDGDSTASTTSFNRVAGLDFNYANEDNSWEAETFYHMSFDEVKRKNSFAFGGFARYQTRRYSGSVFTENVGEGYNPEVGFVPRKGFSRISTRHGLTYYPSSSVIAQHGPSVNIGGTVDPSFFLTDWETSANYGIQFLNTSSLEVSVEHIFQYLQFSFDPTNTGGERLPANTSYEWEVAGIEYSSDSRKDFVFGIEGNMGGYYNGTRLGISGEVNYFFRPFGSFAITANFNDIRLPEPYNSAQLYLIGPRLDLTLTDKIFFTTFIQYNNQADNVNINSRFQWRYAPASDLFIVYTDNYVANDFTTKNRGLVMKLSYWLNI